MDLSQIVDILESEFALKPRVFGQILEEDGNIRVSLSAIIGQKDLRLNRIFSPSVQNERAFRLMAEEFRRAMHETILLDAESVKLDPHK